MNRLLVILLTIVMCQGMEAKALPDSLLTRDAAYRYMFVNPNQSKEIIGAMRARKMLPGWKLDLAEGNLCFSQCLFNKALSHYMDAYRSEAVQSNDSLKMLTLTRLIETYDVKFDEKNLPRYTHELYDLAKSRKDTVYMAMALFMDGKRTHYQGNQETGFARCKEAIGMLQRMNHFWRKNNVLRTFYGFMAKMYFDDKRYEEALDYSRKQEKASFLPHNPEILGRQERNLYRVYAIRSSILMAMGRQDEADSAYQQCVSLPLADPYIIRDIVTYLSKRQRFEEMIPYLRQVKAILTEDSDTLSRNMMLLYYDAGDAFQGMGQFDSASHYYAEAARMSEKINSFHSRQLKESVRESIDLEHELLKHERMQFYTYAGIILLVIAGILYIIYSRRMRERNKLTKQHILSIMNYRYSTLFETNGKHLLHTENPENVDEMVENLRKLDEDSLKDQEKDPNWRRFHEMDKQVVKNALFRNPNFGRDDLMRLAGVDKSTIAAIIQKYAGTNVPGYINTKRMEYAIVLIKIHPEYTLSAVAEACGIKSAATFIRNFKNVYGMTPSEYRQQLEEDNSASPILTQNDKKSEKPTN